MTPEAHRDLSRQLAALLTDIDIAIRVRVRESARGRSGRRSNGQRRDAGRRSAALVAALVDWWRRWELNPRPETLSRRRLRR